MAAALHIYACRVLQRLIECCGAATSDLVDILLQPGTCRIKPDKSQWLMNLHVYTMVYPTCGWFLIGPTWLITRGCLLLGSHICEHWDDIHWYPNFRWCPIIKFHYIPRYVKISSSDTFQDPKWSRYFNLIDTAGGDQLQRLVKDPYSSNVRISEDQKHGDILWNMKGKKFQIWWLISFCLAFRFLGLYRYTVYRYTQFSDMLTIAGDHSSQCIGAYHDNPWVGKT